MPFTLSRVKINTKNEKNPCPFPSSRINKSNKKI